MSDSALNSMGGWATTPTSFDDVKWDFLKAPTTASAFTPEQNPTAVAVGIDNAFNWITDKLTLGGRYTQAAAALGWNVIHDQNSVEGDSFGDMWNRNFDSTIGVVQRGDDQSMAGVTLGQSYLQTLVTPQGLSDLTGSGTGDKPIAAMTPQERDKVFGSGPLEYASGAIDFGNVLVNDPVNLSGPAFKLYKATTMGEKVLIADAPGRMFTGPTKVTKSGFLEDLLTTDKYDQFVTDMTNETSAARLAQHPYLRDPKKVRDTQLASYLLSKTTDRQGTVDTLMLLGDLGTPEAKAEAYQRLLAKGADQGENAYLLDRVMSGEAEAQYAAKYGTDHILDDGIREKQSKVLGEYINDKSNALGRAYADSLNKAMDQPVGILTVTPKTGFAGAASSSRASARADRLYGKPDVTYHQPTKAHPVMAFVDFFSKGRPSGYANTHDLDSYKEFSALLSHVDQHVGGALRTSGESEAWANAYMAANSATDRMNLFRQVEQRGLNILAEKYGLDAETATKVYDFTLAKRKQAMSQYSQDGFFSMLVDGSPVIAAGPLVMRQAANDIHIALDFRQLDKALSRHTADGWRGLFNGPVTDQQLIGKGAQRRDLAVGAMDALNDIFKMSVLLRLGYTVRNLAEAGLSMAANGYLTAAALTLNPREVGSNLLHNRGVSRAIRRDARLQRRGFRDDARDLQAELNDLYAHHRGLQIQEQVATEYLSDFAMKSDDLTPETYQILARLRGEADRTVTYHTTNKPLEAISGDWLATTDNYATAASKMDEAYSYHGLADYGFDPANKLAGKGAPVARGERLMSMIDDARAQLRAGRTLEYKVPGSDNWAPLSEVTIDSFIKARTVGDELRALKGDLDFQFRSREGGAIPEVVSIPSYGKTLDGTVNQFKNMDRAALASYARKHGYGRVVVDDPEWGKTTLVLRDTAAYAGGDGAKSIVERNVRDIVAEAESGTVVALPARARGRNLRKDRRALNRDKGRSGTRRRDRTNGRRAVIPGWTNDQLKHMVDSGLIETLQGLGEGRAAAMARIQQVEKAYAERTAEIASLGSKRRLHTQPGGAFHGPQGAVMYDRTNNEATVNALSGTGDHVAFGPPTAMVGTNVRPTEARYFEGWANTLNHHFRDPETKTLDPLVQRILDGEDLADIEDWLTTTVEGRSHADYLGWGDKIDQRVAELDAAVNMYMPGPVRDLMADGQDVTEQMLRKAFGTRTDLPDLQVRLIPGSAEQKATLVGDSLTARIARRMFRALGSAPETAFARHPMFAAVYQMERDRMMGQLAAKGQTHMTLENFNKVEASAREYARREVNRALYTINRRTDAARQLRLVAPFYGAWENALQRWGAAVWHSPDKIAPMLSKAAFAAQNITMVDENGDAINLGDAFRDIESYQNAQILLPGSDPRRGAANSRVSLQSLDVIMGGQIGPGFGPYFTAPVAEVVKRNPQYEDAVRWIYPVGLPKDGVDNFLPAWTKRLRSMLSNDQQFINDVNRMYMNSYIKWQQEGGDKPTVEQATADAQKFYMLRIATNLLSPASVSYGKEVDYYAQQLRTLQDLHRGEPNGSQVADQEFLDRFPEAFIVLPPLSKNRAGALANVDAVANMKRYSNLAQYAEGAGDLRLFGWVANYGLTYSKDDFSSAAYTWQTNNGPLGSDLSYRGKQQTADLENEAMVSKGWVEYGKYMDVIESRMTAAGINPASKRGVDILKGARKKASEGIRGAGNELWYREYADPDRAKYERRADFFQRVLADEQFMADHGSDPVIGYMRDYFDLRAAAGRALIARDNRGGSKDINAKANEDINNLFSSRVEKLKAGNVEFAAWLTRYFENDPVVF